jgi:peptidyl-tRNA hydrolase
MNDSGTAILKLCSHYQIPVANVIVIYDARVYPVGDFRIHGRAGTGGHNGVGDILSKMEEGVDDIDENANYMSMRCKFERVQTHEATAAAPNPCELQFQLHVLFV